MARVTLQTVADHVGVSRMTVSNAFSRPDQLSADLRRRILLAADELGYVGPDPAARALARGTSGTVGVVLTHTPQDALTDEVAAAFLAGVAAELSAVGLSLTLLPSTEVEGRIPARDVPLDAALIFGADPGEGAVAWLERRRIPLVLVDQDPRSDLPTIEVADRAGAAAAAAHLADLGHRQVGLVTVSRTDGPDQPSHVSGRRVAGWRDGLAGLDPVLIEVERSSVAEGHRAWGVLRESLPGVTGVLCYSDTLAHGLMLAAQADGLRIPTDLSVIGFDDSPVASRLNPPLTTVHQDVAEKGRLAGLALVAAAEGRADEVTSVTLPTRLVVRESTAVPAHGVGPASTVPDPAADGARP